jgi:hypothetical protein
MVTIPTYQAKQGIDPVDYPQVKVDDSVGQALRSVGSASSSVGERAMAEDRQKQKNLTFYKNQLAAEQVSNAQDLKFNDLVKNGSPDGSDLVPQTQAMVEKDVTGLLNDIKDPEERARAAVVWEGIKGKRIAAAQDAADKKQYSFVLSTTRDSMQQEVDSGKLQSPDQWNAYYDGVIKKRIDLVETDPLKRQQLYDVYRKDFRERVYQNNPNAFVTMGRQQGAAPSGPGSEKAPEGAAKAPPANVDQFFGKQLAFAHHELQTTEGRAGQLLKSATTLEDAVRAGLAYERPAQDAANIAFGNRLGNARNVLAGKAPARAMQAFSFFKSQGYTDVQAAGFVGSLMQESGQNLNPHAANPRDPGTSVGIGQWNRDRKARMLAFTGSAGDFPMSTPDAGVSGAASFSMPSGGIFEGMSPTEWNGYVSQARAQVSGMVASSVSDELAALSSSGRYNGQTPSQDDFITAYGEKGQVKWDEYQHAKAVAEQSYKYQSMPTPAILADLKEREAAIGTGEGAAQNLQDYQDLVAAAKPSVEQNQKDRNAYLSDVERRSTAAANRQVGIGNDRAKEFEKMQAEKAAAGEAAKQELAFRDKDPAGYVFAKNPGVRMAWREVNANDPGTLRAAVAATVSAQEALGIPGDKINPLPQPQAEAIAARVKDGSLPPEARMNALLQPFGMVDAPEHQEQMARQLVRAGLSPQVVNVVEAWKRNDTGAASRIFQAATLGKEDVPKMGDTEDKLNASVTNAMFAAGSIPSYFYNMDLGDPQSVTAANSDFDLVKNMARLSVASGMDQDTAIQQAIGDIFGKVQAVDQHLQDGGNIRGLVDADTDMRSLNAGLGEAKKTLIDATQGYIARVYGQPQANELPEEFAAVFRAAQFNEMNRILNEGVWRNYGDGWAFWDTQNRGFVGDADGKPIAFSNDDIKRLGGVFLGGDAVPPEPAIKDPQNFSTPQPPADQPFGAPPSPEPAPGKQGAIDLPSPRSSLADNLKSQQQQLFADGPLAKMKEQQG